MMVIHYITLFYSHTVIHTHYTVSYSVSESNSNTWHSHIDTDWHWQYWHWVLIMTCVAGKLILAVIRADSHRWLSAADSSVRVHAALHLQWPKFSKHSQFEVVLSRARAPTPTAYVLRALTHPLLKNEFYENCCHPNRGQCACVVSWWRSWERFHSEPLRPKNGSEKLQNFAFWNLSLSHLTAFPMGLLRHSVI